MSATDQTAAAPAPSAPPAETVRRVPSWIWLVLVALIAAVAIHNVFDTRGDAFFEWLNDAVVVAAAGLAVARGFGRDALAPAWRWIGAGLVFWAFADVLFTALYVGNPHPPYPSIADAFWIVWYPLTAIGGALLIKGHLPRFELHRWMDGLAVMLVVLTAGGAIYLEPALEHTHDSLLTTLVDFSYPVMDVLLIGGVLGVYGLLGWRPGRTWHLLGLGLLMMVLADAAFAVQEARGTPLDSEYEFAWTFGVVLIAWAAWTSTPGAPRPPVYGWRAVALPLAGQLLAVAIQIAGLVEGSERSERVLTLAVLFIAGLQIAVSRPRAPGERDPGAPSATDRDEVLAGHLDPVGGRGHRARE